MSERLEQWKARARRALPTILAGVACFVLGALIFGLRAPDISSPAVGTDAAPAVSAAQDQPTIWTCAMHPQIRQPEPGQCPICGMDLIPVNNNTNNESSAARIVLSERAATLARLRTTAVRRGSDPSMEIRLLGRIETDETSRKAVTAWTGGRIDRLHVNVTGQRVGAGQVIATMYSPEIFAAHQDLLVAKRQVERLGSGVESARRAAEAALDAARDRLRLLGVPDKDLAQLEKQDKPARQVPIRTPFGGTVIERVATEGAYVTTGAVLYRLANLSTLWVQLDAYESDLPRLRTGQKVRIEVDALEGETFEGRVEFIDPTVDSRRRTAQVRVKVDNADGRLRPGMFAQAAVAAELAKESSAPLLIPASAPLFTGKRALVYVEVEGADRPTYEARTVRLGPRLGDAFPVIAGLSEGEKVVSRGAFALDADLQIRGGMSMMNASDDRVADEADQSVHLPADQLHKLKPIVDAYLAIQRALAADDLAAAKKAADETQTALSLVTIAQPPAAAEVWTTTSRDIRNHSRHIGHAKSIETARAGFEGLTEAIESLLRRFGNPLEQPLELAFCSMAFGSRGATWLQQGTTIDNAYFGESMRSCGEIRATVQPGAHLTSPHQTAAPAAPPAKGGHQH